MSETLRSLGRLVRQQVAYFRLTPFTRRVVPIVSLWEALVNDTISEREMRIVIRAATVAGGEVAPIPARVFARTFGSLMRALRVAHKATIGESHVRKTLYVSHLKMGSNEFGIGGNEIAVESLRRAAFDTYRSNFTRVSQSPEMVKATIILGQIYKKGYSISAVFKNEELPLDEFFFSQTERLVETPIIGPVEPPQFFAGNVIGSYDGRLGDIDYRGPVWKGHLLLNGSQVSIECVFDRSQGEDSINPHGNKRVSITGRAIYTGEGALPARIEVITIQAIPAASHYREMAGSLNIHRFANWSRIH